MEKDNVAVIGIYPGPIETDLAKEVPYPEKATPEYAAANIVKGIAEGQTYIFPDPMARQVEQLWSTDNRNTCLDAREGDRVEPESNEPHRCRIADGRAKIDSKSQTE